jgi:hypothetical protein
VKTRSRAAAALALALAVAIGGTLGTTVSASAEPTPTPTPTSSDAHPTFVTYAGTTRTIITQTGQVEADSFPVTVRIDCSDGDCVLTGFEVTNTDDGTGPFDLTQGMRLVLVDGKGSFAMPSNGDDKCASDWIGAGTMTVDATATGITGTRTTAAGGDDINCGSGGTLTLPAFSVVVTGTVSGGDPCVLDSSCPTPSPTPTAQPATTTGPTHVSGHHASFSAPSTLSALPTVHTALTVRNLLWAAAVTVVLVLLIAFPSYLFNNVSGQLALRIRAWWDARRPRSARANAAAAAAREVEFRGWPWAAGGVLLASLISSFVDPSFGFNGSSVRVYLSILTSFLLDAVVGWFLLIYLVRRARPHTTASFRFAPASLLVVAAAVLFTRLTGFAPGIIFGLVAGVAFGAILATAEKAKVALVGLGYSFVVAVIGWIGYSIVSGVAGSHPGAGIVFAQETLSSMAVGGISALPIALVPLRGLTGFDVFSWNRWAWGAAYAVGLVGFFVVLMPMPFSWTGVHINLWVWMGVYFAYALLAFAAWLTVTRPWKRAILTPPSESPESA